MVPVATETTMDEIPPTELQVILDHIYAGHKIEAIKHYKDLRRVSLLDAKQFIEKLTVDLQEQSPEKFAPSPKSGCFGAILLWFSLGASLVASCLIGLF